MTPGTAHRPQSRSLLSRPYGEVVEIPDPVGITLDTEKLKNYAS